MSILIVFAIGIIAGVMAAFLSGTSRSLFFAHAAVGIFGSIIGGALLPQLVGAKSYSPYQLDAVIIVGACIGAIVLLAAARLLRIER